MSYLKRYWRVLISTWIAFVFVQSLFFKFSNSYETQHIFGTLGNWLGLDWFATTGGWVIGGAELVASIMLFSRIWPWGGLLAFEIMSGAIVFHLFTPLGIVMPAYDSAGVVIGDDGGLLFVMACFTWLCSLILVVYDWTSASSQIRTVLPKKVNE